MWRGGWVGGKQHLASRTSVSLEIWCVKFAPIIFSIFHLMTPFQGDIVRKSQWEVSDEWWALTLSHVTNKSCWPYLLEVLPFSPSLVQPFIHSSLDDSNSRCPGLSASSHKCLSLFLFHPPHDCQNDLWKPPMECATALLKSSRGAPVAPSMSSLPRMAHGVSSDLNLILPICPHHSPPFSSLPLTLCSRDCFSSFTPCGNWPPPLPLCSALCLKSFLPPLPSSPG